MSSLAAGHPVGTRGAVLSQHCNAGQKALPEPSFPRLLLHTMMREDICKESNWGTGLKWMPIQISNCRYHYDDTGL